MKRRKEEPAQNVMKSTILNSVSCLSNSHDGDQSSNYVTKILLFR